MEANMRINPSAATDPLSDNREILPADFPCYAAAKRRVSLFYSLIISLLFPVIPVKKYIFPVIGNLARGLARMPRASRYREFSTAPWNRLSGDRQSSRTLRCAISHSVPTRRKLSR